LQRKLYANCAMTNPLLARELRRPLPFTGAQSVRTVCAFCLARRQARRVTNFRGRCFSRP
jgi:hypothetical protein